MSLSPVSRSALWLAAPLAFAFGSPTLHAREEADLPPAAIVGDVPTQLPVNARPRHYAISITPDADKLSFRGKIGIEMELLKPSTSVTLNAADLSFASASITPADGKIMNATASVNADAQTVTFTFPKHLPAGTYRIDTDYSGKFTHRLRGSSLLIMRRREKRSGRFSLSSRLRTPAMSFRAGMSRSTKPPSI